MLFGVVLGLAGFFKTRDEDRAVVDDFPFRLFYGFTCGILFLSSALVGLVDLVGKNIDCYKGNPAVNQYCWVTGTHLLVNTDHDKGLGQISYGEERCEKNLDGIWVTEDGTECVKTHSYYQWVPYVLIIQGFLFFVPRMFWLKFEEGKMSSISDGVRFGAGAVSSAKSGDRLKTVAANVAAYVNMREAGHARYGWAYLVAQALNLVVLLGAVFFTDKFLDGQFLSLGPNWIRSLGNEYTDDGYNDANVLYRIFPRLTKCEFQKFGSGGHLESNEYICVLAPNIVSEKIFVFLWFWFSVLVAVGAANLSLVCAMAFRSGGIRTFFMMRAVFSRKLRRHLVTNESMKRKVERMDFGKFLFLYLLGRNVDYFAYKKILDLAVNDDDENEYAVGNVDGGDGGTASAPPAVSSETAAPGERLRRQISRPDVCDAGGEEITLPSYMREYSQERCQKTIPKDYPLKIFRYNEEREEEDAGAAAGAAAAPPLPDKEDI